MSISELTSGSDVTRQAITKHLRLMHDAGLVKETRHGRESVWELEPGRLADARRYLERISQQWDDALGRLKAFVEMPDEDQAGSAGVAARRPTGSTKRR